MDGFNRIISFVLGLVVVIVFFAVVTGRINFKGGLPKLTGATATPTKSASTTPTPISKIVIPTGSYGSYKNNGKATSIPATGLPTLFVPSLIAGALGGAFLRKTGKK